MGRPGSGAVLRSSDFLKYFVTYCRGSGAPRFAGDVRNNLHSFFDVASATSRSSERPRRTGTPAAGFSSNRGQRGCSTRPTRPTSASPRRPRHDSACGSPSTATKASVAPTVSNSNWSEERAGLDLSKRSSTAPPSRSPRRARASTAWPTRCPGRCRQAPDPLSPHPRPAPGLPRPAQQPADLPAPHGAADRRPGPRGARHPGRRLPLSSSAPGIPEREYCVQLRRKRPAFRPAPLCRKRASISISGTAPRRTCWCSATTRRCSPPGPSHRLRARQRPGRRRTGDQALQPAPWPAAPRAPPAATTTSRSRGCCWRPATAPLPTASAEPDLEDYDHPGRLRDRQRGKLLSQRALSATAPTGAWAKGQRPAAAGQRALPRSPSTRARSGTTCGCSAKSSTKGKQRQVLEENVTSDTSASTDDSPAGYRNRFLATPWEVFFRPPLEHPKPRVLGSQTAVVTGPPGEEIHCAPRRRSGCSSTGTARARATTRAVAGWRVASGWAGNGYGGIVIPRVGMKCW